MRFPEIWSAYRTAGDDPQAGELGCGFIRKEGGEGSRDIIFQRYGALVLLQGSGFYRDEYGVEAELCPGSFVQRLPGRLHVTPVDDREPWIECFVTMSTGLFQALAKMNFINAQQPVMQLMLNQELIDRFVQLRDHLRDATDHELRGCALEMQSLLFDIAEMGEGIGQKTDVIQKACRLLSEDLERRLAMKAVADQLGVGYDSFRKSFREQMGVSPGDYRIHRRIDFARTRLSQGNVSVKQVASELGYPDPYTFSRQFKHTTGVSPTEFMDTR